jgi:hypothetical protein
MKHQILKGKKQSAEIAEWGCWRDGRKASKAGKVLEREVLGDSQARCFTPFSMTRAALRVTGEGKLRIGSGELGLTIDD